MSLKEAVGGVVVPIGIVIGRPLVGSYLWEWFAVPLGAPSISMAHAMGLALLVWCMTPHIANDRTVQLVGNMVANPASQEAKEVFKGFFDIDHPHNDKCSALLGIGIPALVLLVGYILWWLS